MCQRLGLLVGTEDTLARVPEALTNGLSDFVNSFGQTFVLAFATPAQHLLRGLKSEDEETVERSIGIQPTLEVFLRIPRHPGGPVIEMPNPSLLSQWQQSRFSLSQECPQHREDLWQESARQRIVAAVEIVVTHGQHPGERE